MKPITSVILSPPTGINFAKDLLLNQSKSRFFGLRPEGSPLGGRPQNDILF
jgi:hypothetical protein